MKYAHVTVCVTPLGQFIGVIEAVIDGVLADVIVVVLVAV